MNQAFTKKERLCSRKIIDELFSSGKSFSVHPFRIIWIETKLNASYPVQIVISVPKKKIKKAVERNKIKRRIREAYRKNKYFLYEHLAKTGKQIAMMIIYTQTEEMMYKEIENKIIITLQRLTTKDESIDE